MNTRIQDLKTQALEWFARQHGLELIHLSPTPDPLSQKQIDEKFAELIIRECLGLYDSIDNGNLPHGTDNYFLAIERHFGANK